MDFCYFTLGISYKSDIDKLEVRPLHLKSNKFYHNLLEILNETPFCLGVYRSTPSSKRMFYRLMSTVKRLHFFLEVTVKTLGQAAVVNSRYCVRKISGVQSVPE